jgi:hypothetical protein|nr:MAG TPA: hypothetical protein [Bacteriophage sp.]
MYGQYNSYYPYQYQQPRYDLQQNQPLFNQQQNIQPQQQAGLNGKVVQAVEQITANDVPMDGSIAVFPKQDMSEIYTKSWNADGTIRTIVYKPYTASQPDVANSSADMSKMKMGLSDEATEAFMARFDSLEKKFDELMPKIAPKRSGGLKKEANENE